MNKLVYAIGIPLAAVGAIVVYENPKPWWLAFAVPLVLLRFLMKRTLETKDLDPALPELSPTVESSHIANRGPSGSEH